MKNITATDKDAKRISALAEDLECSESMIVKALLSILDSEAFLNGVHARTVVKDTLIMYMINGRKEN